MNKSLEALEKISWRYVNEPTFQEWCDTIKQDLERLEKIENLMEKYKIKNIAKLETIIMLCFVLQGAFDSKDDEVLE